MRFLFALISLLVGGWGIANDWMTPSPDSTRCRLGGCPTEQLYAAMDAQAASAKLETAVLINPADPFAWCGYGETLSGRGEVEKANAAFVRATDLGQGVAAVWMRAANFYVAHDRREQEFEALKQVLSKTDVFDQVAFSYLTASKVPTANLLGLVIPSDDRVARAWLTWVESHGSVSDLTSTWNWMQRNRLTDQKSAEALSQTLWGKKAFGAAQQSWVEWLGAERRDYGRSQFLLNRKFEAEPDRSPFNWTLDTTPGVTLTRNSGLEVQFIGTENVELRNVRQLTYLRPGMYTFAAEIEAHGISTDEGPFFEITDAVNENCLRVEGSKILGDRKRGWVKLSFTVPRNTEAILISLRRKRTFRFDNKIAGKLQVYDTSLTASGD